MERDYVLGTHDEEIARLGLQHEVWRSAVLDCWKRAGITAGKRVLDIGAGPGYATVDLAKIVGPAGEVVALERSAKFVRSLRNKIAEQSLTNVRVCEIDLMTDDLPRGDYGFSWCRWVMSFVSDPARLVRKLAGVMPTGGIAIFHEYAHYETWRFLPRLPLQEKFREHVIATWRESGGEPDGANPLPELLAANGFRIRSARPQIFVLRPNDPMWQWPTSFIDVYLARLQEMGRIDQPFAEKLEAELATARRGRNSLMITPLVLEIIAEKRTE
ncbi:MAG: class I SAM-dependent methyltransferase [Chthoniobacterales bacterium]